MQASFSDAAFVCILPAFCGKKQTNLGGEERPTEGISLSALFFCACMRACCVALCMAGCVCVCVCTVYVMVCDGAEGQVQKKAKQEVLVRYPCRH